MATLDRVQVFFTVRQVMVVRISFPLIDEVL